MTVLLDIAIVAISLVFLGIVGMIAAVAIPGLFMGVAAPWLDWVMPVKGKKGKKEAKAHH